ncbi:MAG: adenylate/guanylate cyclase domain-containing protein [Elusimicrobia bacterium]|nr:adenylate/guanylate cyclase domain-containing protein [Elusimicrobiota bacterium]
MDPIKISVFADELLERCARRRLGLKATLDEFLPAMARRFGAAAAAVETLTEDLRKEAFRWGAGSPRLRWVHHPLDVAGRRVGSIAFGYRAPAGPGHRACLEAVCEELDGVLWNIQTSAIKQRLMERVTRCLTKSVLREAIDEAVGALHAEIPFRHLGLVYLNDDASGGNRIQYRIYKGRRCVRDSEQRPNRALSRAIGCLGLDLLNPDRHVVRHSLGFREGMGFTLSGQAAGARSLGKLVAEVDGGLDTFGRDLMRIFANSISQRLIDYNRERRHLAQFFAPAVVSELLSDPDYRRKHLSPRVKPIAILYADINSFTKLCERALRRPDRIGEFVDRWSEGAVRIAWERGGVFDKMVGDCVIIHFGPPFYRGGDGQNAREALLAAREIQAFTRRLERDPRFRSLPRKAKLKGLGVAVGINLCPAAIGLFGPNQDFTAFSSGMNQAARLQSKAGFRETLVMESVVAAMKKAGLARGMRFEGPFEVEVKNVAKPLRYYRLKGR